MIVPKIVRFEDGCAVTIGHTRDEDAMLVMAHGEGVEPVSRRVGYLMGDTHASFVERVYVAVREAHEELHGLLTARGRGQRLGLPAGRHERGWPS
jgi:hypothetical protein